MKSLQFGSGNRNLVQNINKIICENEFGRQLWEITKEYCKKYFYLTQLEQYQTILEFNSIYEGLNGLVNYNKNNSVITMISIFYLHMYKIYSYLLLENPGEKNCCSFGHSVGSFASVMAARQYENKEAFVEEYKTALLFAISCVVRSYINYQKLDNHISNNISTPMLILNNIKLRMANKLITKFNETSEVPMEISLVNNQNSIVVSSSNANLEKFLELNSAELQALNVNYNYLECNIPFHCSLLENAKKEVLIDNQTIKFTVNKENLRFPVLSTIDGSNYQTQDDILGKLLDSLLCKCVNWSSVITSAVSLNTTEIIDFGPMLPVSLFTKDCISNLKREVNISQI